MGYFISLSKPATIHWLDASEWALLCFGLAVFAGIWGEIKLAHGSRNFIIAEYVVLFGILGELIADGGVFLFSTQLQTISDSENAALGVTASKANKRAGKALDRATQLEASNKQLGIDLELEKQKTARFQKEADAARLAFERSLTMMSARYKLVNLGRAQILRATSPFAGQKAEIQTCQGLRADNEINLLSQSLLEILAASKWETHFANLPTCLNGFGRSGVTVSANNPSSDSTMAAGRSLAIVLEKLLWGDFNEEDFKSRVKLEPLNGTRWFWVMPVWPGEQPLAPDTVRIFIVGHQPQ